MPGKNPQTAAMKRRTPDLERRARSFAGHPIKTFLRIGRAVPKSPEKPKPVWGRGVSSRPLRPGEQMTGAGGVPMTEYTITVSEPDLNGGAWTNIPSIWMVGGQPQMVGQEAAIRMATEYQQRQGWQFPKFMTSDQADQAARSRSDAGGVNSGPLGRSVKK